MFLVVLILGLCALCAPGTSIPVYGTTRYGRPGAAPAPAPAASLYYRAARPYPYADSYPDDLYYQPVPVVHYPYYTVGSPYSDDVYRPYPYPYLTPYGYYGNEDFSTDEGAHGNPQMVPGARADALPVGQETWFAGDSTPDWRTDYDDVNAAFLQNLIMSQMYDDALDKSGETNEHPGQNSAHSNEEYDDHRNPEYFGERDTRDFEDEDVRELKALAGKPLFHVPKTNVFSGTGNANIEPPRRVQPSWYRELSTPKPMRHEEDHHMSDDYQNDEGWINWGSKRSPKISKVETIKRIMTPKPTMVVSTSTAAPVIKSMNGGQKEEVLLRPATPARHPFPEPVLQLLAGNSAGHVKRNPSVYDTIKRLLSMEESYKPNSENKGVMQKRFISTEEDLVGELKGLKRRSTA